MARKLQPKDLEHDVESQYLSMAGNTKIIREILSKLEDFMNDETQPFSATQRQSHVQLVIERIVYFKKLRPNDERYEMLNHYYREKFGHKVEKIVIK